MAAPTATGDPDQPGVPCSACNGNDVDINLGSGEVYSAADFGYVGTASIGDFVWDDTSNNGNFDPGESGLSDVTVELTWFGPNDSLGGDDDIIFTTTTDGNGGYDFTGLPSGELQRRCRWL